MSMPVRKASRPWRAAFMQIVGVYSFNKHILLFHDGVSNERTIWTLLQPCWPLIASCWRLELWKWMDLLIKLNPTNIYKNLKKKLREDCKLAYQGIRSQHSGLDLGLTSGCLKTMVRASTIFAYCHKYTCCHLRPARFLKMCNWEK